MILGIATVVVLVLVAVALLPARKRDQDGSTLLLGPLSRPTNVRQQQLTEEAEAIADEYQRRADEAWRDELGEKAADLLKSTSKPATKSTTRKSTASKSPATKATTRKTTTRKS